MGRVSSIKLLGKELRELIADLHDKGVTLDQILDKLRELGAANVSRSALGRYTLDLDKVGDRLRRSRDIADALVKRLGDGPESRTAQLNLELMQSVILDLTAGGENGEGVELDAEQAMFLARAMKDLATAQKTQAEFVLKIRREIETEQKGKLDAMERQAESGRRKLDPETLRQVRSEIYGLPG